MDEFLVSVDWTKVAWYAGTVLASVFSTILAMFRKSNKRLSRIEEKTSQLENNGGDSVADKIDAILERQEEFHETNQEFHEVNKIITKRLTIVVNGLDDLNDRVSNLETQNNNHRGLFGGLFR